MGTDSSQQNLQKSHDRTVVGETINDSMAQYSATYITMVLAMV